ncbi:MAG: ABC transporter permease [Deltaproteobacteria bacterium]|nr:ABC transporter permease [Deltaproteobacteria bacterium]
MKGARIAALALQDASHEWRLSLCMIMAIAAIASPLLLFFGLKYGTVETLRSRLLHNPSTLELLPVTDKLLNADWFARWRENPRTAFLVPHTRKLSAQADIAPAGSGAPLSRVDIQPTMPGDILLTRFNAPVPGKDECVLTDRAAALAGVKTGDAITMQVTRENARVKAAHNFTVAGVLPPRAGALPAAYILLEQLEAIEDFKDGRAVPAFGWPGSDPLAYPVFPSLLLFFPDPDKSALDPVREALLVQNTGFSFLEKLDREELAAAGLFSAGEGYRLKTSGAPADAQNIAAVRDKLRGKNLLILPEAYPQLRLDIITGPDASSGNSRDPARGCASISLKPGAAYAISDSAGNAPVEAGLPPAADSSAWASLTAAPALFEILVSETLPEKLSPTGTATGDAGKGLTAEVRAVFAGDVSGETRAVTFQALLRPAPGTPEQTALLPLALLGSLNLLEQRPLLYGPTNEKPSGGSKALLLGRRGYSGFRMYASNLESVAPLAQALEEEGIRVNTRADRIDEVLQLNKYLNLLFWVIAAASLSGGTACLLSSIYANVERKRRDLAVLRLLGVHGGALVIFPLVSGFILTLGGFALGLAIFHALSAAINFLFSASLEPGESFCLLTGFHQIAALGLAISLALLAGLAASRRAAIIDPAESLRDE